MGQIGAPELLLLVIVLVLLFGSAQLPKLAKSVGLAKKEFEDAKKPDTSA